MGSACLCLNAWMVSWLRVKEAIICLSSLCYFTFSRSHQSAQQVLCAERRMMHTVILSDSIIHAFLLAFSPSKLVCLHQCLNSFEHCRLNMGLQKDLHKYPIRFHWTQCEEMLTSVQLMAQKCRAYFIYCNPRARKQASFHKSKDALYQYLFTEHSEATVPQYLLIQKGMSAIICI